MSKKVGYNNNSTIPTVGDAGHMVSAVGKRKVGSTQVSDLEKLKRITDSECPVNRNIPTKMLESSFRQACLKFSGIAEKDKDKKTKGVITTPTGFKSSNKRTCLDCKRGKLIAKG